MFGISNCSAVILLSGRLIQEIALLPFFMTDQCIYTFPSLFQVAYILCKIIVIKCSFTNSGKVQYFISIEFILVSITRKEKLILGPYRFSNSLGDPWFWQLLSFTFRQRAKWGIFVG